MPRKKKIASPVPQLTRQTLHTQIKTASSDKLAIFTIPQRTRSKSANLVQAPSSSAIVVGSSISQIPKKVAPIKTSNSIKPENPLISTEPSTSNDQMVRLLDEARTRKCTVKIKRLSRSNPRKSPNKSGKYILS